MIKLHNYLTTFFVSICCCAKVFGSFYNDPPAFVSIIHPDDLRIMDLTNNSECGRFRVSLFSNPKKCADGSLLFSLRIDLGNFKEKIRFDKKIIEDSNSGKIFNVIIPENELENKTFFKEIQLTADNANFKPDKIKLKIEPKVEIFAEQKQVNFGKISHNGVRLVSENSPSVLIKYSILKDAVCEVTSKNNFRLRNKDSYIPYSMNDIYENGEINLPSNRDEYMANFKILNSRKKPSAGSYSDKITFSIKTHL